MKISEMLIMVIVAFGVLSGMLGFMGDLSQTYNLTVPDALQNQTAQYARNINQTARDMIETGSTEGGWHETTYNIFFKLPASLINTIISSVTTTSSFVSIMVSESNMIVPDWFVVMIGVLISIVFAFSIVYLILGRRI